MKIKLSIILVTSLSLRLYSQEISYDERQQVTIVPYSNCQSGKITLDKLGNILKKEVINLASVAAPNSTPKLTSCGESLNLKATGGTEGKYIWYDEAGKIIGNATSSSYQTPAISKSTKYFVAYTTAENCLSPQTEINIEAVGSISSPSIQEGKTVQLCSGSSVKLTATALATGYGYLWNTGEKTQSIQVNQAGSYTVQAVHANGICKSDAATTQVVLNTVVQPTVSEKLNNGIYTLRTQADLVASGIQWYYEGTVLTGETSNAITPGKSGSYYYTCTIGNCTATSNKVSIVLTGVEEEKETEIKVYPNPTEGKLYIVGEASNFVDLNLSLVSETGQILITEQLHEAPQLPYQLDLKNYTKGAYLLRLTKGTQTKIFKIIKQ